MKRVLLLSLFLISAFSLFAQDKWNLVWTMNELPFVSNDPKPGSELGMVKAGFDTDNDGWGEFICAWTDMDENYIIMYEATGDNTYEIVWYFKYPIPANSFAGIAVGDIDNNGLADIITTMPSVAGEDPNPTRLWMFEWNGVQGENKYGRYVDGVSEPTSEWNYAVEDGIDFRPYSLVIEDIDKDGANELITGVRQGARGREVLVSSVNGELNGFGSFVIEYNFQQSFGGSLYSVTTGDLDNDGQNEIYAQIWDLFTMRIFECKGDGQYEITTEIDKLYQAQGVDHGALDGVRVADVNNDGVNELYIASTEDPNALFIITNISDVSQITPADIKEFYHIPINIDGGLRSMYIADPDHDNKLSLMIAGERNGQIYDLEYSGEGDPADSASWNLNVLIDLYAMSDTASTQISPRLFYGSPAADMDKDGKDEYVFVNYSSDFNSWKDDAYLYMIEIESSTDVRSNTSLIPNSLELKQNYPNPFNPSTQIEFALTEATQTNLIVYDILGREIKSLVNEFLPAGVHKVDFDASNLSAGTYFYTLKAGNNLLTNKMVLLK